jgi:hypothetical protein
MIAHSQRRPVSITLFAVLFFAGGLHSFVDGLLRIPEALEAPGALPWLSRDGQIIWHSAWLLIALIPIALIWTPATTVVLVRRLA